METPAEKFFGILLGLALLVLFAITILTDEDFVFQVHILLRVVLIDLAVIVVAYVGFAISVARNEGGFYLP